MSCMNNDRATLNEIAQALEDNLAKSELPGILQRAFDSGMEVDEIGYVVAVFTERTVRRYIVQDQLKKAANKDKNC